MSTEIERRFLLKDRRWRPNGIRPMELDQGRYFFGEDAIGSIVFFLGFPHFCMHSIHRNTVKGQQTQLISVPLSIADGWALAIKCSNFRPTTGGWKGDLPAGWMARVRSYDNQRYVMDIKGPRIGTTRAEFGEYALSRERGHALLTAAPLASRLRKLRYAVPIDGNEWVIDIYQGRLRQHAPTVDIEIPTADTPITIPDWVGEEITHRKTFTNKAERSERMERHTAALADSQMGNRDSDSSSSSHG